MNADWNSISVQLHGSFLDREIRRTNRNLLLFSLLLIVGMGAYGVAEWRYYYNYFTGPIEMNADSLDGIKHPDDQLRYFVRVKGDQSSDTGLQEIRHETRNGVQSKSVEAKYCILLLGNRLLIVKKIPYDNGTTFQGALGELPSDLRSEIIDPLLKQYPNASQAFLPVMLDATDFRSGGYISLAICLFLALLALWNMRKVYRRRMAPATHPIVKSASMYGSLVATAQQFDVELKGSTFKLGKATITTSWVFLPSTFRLAMCHIPDLVWAYKRATTRRRNSQYIGTTYDAILYDRHGLALQMQADQKKVDAMLSLLAQRAPWAIFGYSDDLDQTRGKNWAGLVAAVDARRSGVSKARSA
jgi:hypothetical protein